MTPRDTNTGAVLEAMILPALKRRKYEFEKQVHVGKRLGGKKHIVDVVAGKNGGKSILISLKWQQVSGTAEQKVPFEVICLAKTLLSNKKRFKRAYLVLGGEGWTLRKFYTSGGLAKHLKYARLVKIMTLESFVSLVNSGQL